MQIAQIAPLTEAIPPKLYGGTERVISWLTDELVALGHEVVLFASGDSRTSAQLEPCWPKALRLDGSVRDPNALHIAMLENASAILARDDAEAVVLDLVQPCVPGWRLQGFGRQGGTKPSAGT
jgi:nucleoside-diphosphate-sugar epimerase